MRVFGAALSLALLLPGATLGFASPEGEAPGAQPAEGRGDPRDLGRKIAEPWISAQRPDGSFPDYMATRGSPARDRYGEAMLGYGLLKTGLQRRDARAVDSGLRALLHSVANPRPAHSVVFEQLALAAGYNLARAAVPLHPLFAANRSAWESRLRQMKPVWLGRGRGRYFNQHLVDAVAVIELARSGLRSRLAGTVSADPEGARRLAERLVNSGLPRRLVPRTARSGRAGTTTVASDGALAYHALTIGFYARAVRLLGRRASPRARRLLGRLARATWALAGPDGDVAYFGRSQGQAWTLALTAYGTEMAARGAGRNWAARHRAGSRRTLQRLGAVHVGGPTGLYLTPAFRTDPGAAMAAQEDYVSGSAYSGLTLAGLGWAGDHASLGTRSSGLAADGRSAFLVDRGPRRFATVSTGTVWFAVRQSPASPRELASGAGLIALKVRDRRGRWRDVLPHGVLGRPPDSAGPLLRTQAGMAATPLGRGLTLGPGPSVRLDADLLTPSRRRARRAAIAFTPTRCGVRILPRGRPGERWEYSTFFPSRGRPRRHGKRAVAAGVVRVGYGGRGHIVTGGRYVSPSYGSLVRSRLSVRAPVSFSVALTGRCEG